MWALVQRVSGLLLEATAQHVYRLHSLSSTKQKLSCCSQDGCAGVQEVGREIYDSAILLAGLSADLLVIHCKTRYMYLSRWWSYKARYSLFTLAVPLAGPCDRNLWQLLQQEAQPSVLLVRTNTLKSPLLPHGRSGSTRRCLHGILSMLQIVSHRLVSQGKRRKQTEYLVRWDGYDAAHDMWLPDADLSNSSQKVREYWDQLKSQ